MDEAEALRRMVPPGKIRPGKFLGGVIQIWVTRSCDKCCFGCTQGSNLRGNSGFITPEQFEQACKSLSDYWGVVGMFGGNPAMHPEFDQLCTIMQQYIPRQQRGLWCNNPLGHGAAMRKTFNPAVSNLNVHLDAAAYTEFKRDWPECHPFGLHDDCRHSPPYVAMKDILPDKTTRWDLIAQCDINQHWSAMIGVFRGELRAWFCEVAGAQAILQQHDPDYPDTGMPIDANGCSTAGTWWRLPIANFTAQVEQHCHSCGVPLRGYGTLAQADDGIEYTTATYSHLYKPKKRDRRVYIATELHQIQPQSLPLFTNYMGNAKR